MTSIEEIVRRLEGVEAWLATTERERDEYRALYLETMERCRKLEIGILSSKSERLPDNDGQLSLGVLSLVLNERQQVSSIGTERVRVTSSRDHGGPRRPPTSWRRSRAAAAAGDEYVADHDGRGARRRGVAIIGGRTSVGYIFGASFFRFRAEARSRWRSSASRSR